MSRRCFLTGCDTNNEWLLPWFIENYYRHNSTPLVFGDFGVSETTRAWIDRESPFADVIPVASEGVSGWFLKPRAMMECPFDEICWLDNDCEVLGDLSGVFEHVQPDRLAMVQDIPWTRSRGQKWHNTGVVAFCGRPPILQEWMEVTEDTSARGDQEVLHELLQDPARRTALVTDLPNRFNFLRLQLPLGQELPDKLVMHWTGADGKARIRATGQFQESLAGQ